MVGNQAIESPANAYNMGRVPIGGCDFSVRIYTYDDVTNDTSLSHFALQDEDLNHKVSNFRVLEFQIPAIKLAQNLTGGKLKLLGSPWSSPGWMKTNGQANVGTTKVQRV